jgi:hypothetical protein
MVFYSLVWGFRALSRQLVKTPIHTVHRWLNTHARRVAVSTDLQQEGSPFLVEHPSGRVAVCFCQERACVSWFEYQAREVTDVPGCCTGTGWLCWGLGSHTALLSTYHTVPSYMLICGIILLRPGSLYPQWLQGSHCSPWCPGACLARGRCIVHTCWMIWQEACLCY